MAGLANFNPINHHYTNLTRLLKRLSALSEAALQAGTHGWA